MKRAGFSLSNNFVTWCEVFCMFRRASIKKVYTTKTVINIAALFICHLHICMLFGRYKSITISDSEHTAKHLKKCLTINDSSAVGAGRRNTTEIFFGDA